MECQADSTTTCKSGQAGFYANAVAAYQQRFAHRDGGPARLQALVFAKSPTAWHLPK